MADESSNHSPEPVAVPFPVSPPGDTKEDSKSGTSSARQIPGYQILGKLGAGAMAVVFKARQISLNRIVAIKVLPKSLSSDEEYVERFYQEGRAAAQLNHTNIVQAYDVGESHGYHYFVMEYVEGETVYDRIHAGQLYSEAEALNVIIQIGRALDHAHSLGLIHRDVKPKNIMITTDGVAKLMDMGLARVANDEDAIAAETGRLFGTPYYISPEQILGKSDVDFRCDMYGLGGTLYHMVTGKPPFEGKDSKDVMIKHVKEKLLSPDRHNLDLSFGLCKTIHKMLAKRPEDRYPSTEAMLEDLQSVDFLLEVEEGSERASGLGQLGNELAGRSHAVKTSGAPKPIASMGSVKDPVVPQALPKEPAASPMAMVLVILLSVSVLLNLLLLFTLLWK